MEEEILKVRMLGGFSMVYQEKTLVFDRNYILRLPIPKMGFVP